MLWCQALMSVVDLANYSNLKSILGYVFLYWNVHNWVFRKGKAARIYRLSRWKFFKISKHWFLSYCNDYSNGLYHRTLNLKRCITTISLVFSHKKAWLFHWCSWDIFHSWNRKTHLKFLITKIYLTFLSFSDTLLSFSRSCYPTSGPNHCSKGVDKELKMDVILCSEFCNTDNCNSAFTSQPHPLFLLLTFSTTFILLNSLSGFHDISPRWR